MNKYIFNFFGNIALLDPLVNDTVIILVNRFNHPNISNSVYSWVPQNCQLVMVCN